MSKTIHSDFSGHTLYVREISGDELPAMEYKDSYTKFYAVHNFDANGVVFMYLGKGDQTAPDEIVAWYPNGQFWSSCGTTFKTAIEGAQRDGWMHTK